MDICTKDLREHVLKMASLVEASLSGSLSMDKTMEDIFALEKRLMSFTYLSMMHASSIWPLRAQLPKIFVLLSL